MKGEWNIKVVWSIDTHALYLFQIGNSSSLFKFLGDNHNTVWLPYFYKVKNPTTETHNILPSLHCQDQIFFWNLKLLWKYIDSLCEWSFYSLFFAIGPGVHSQTKSTVYHSVLALQSGEHE